MPKHTFNILLNSRIVVAVCAIILLFLGLVLVAQGLVDTKRFHEQIVESIKAKTGKDVTVHGNISVALLPMPTVYVPGLELRDAEDSETPSPSLTVDMVQLKVDVTTIFSSAPHVSGVVLQHPILELVRAHDNLIHWDWLNAELLKSALQGGSAVALSIDGGKIIYHDNRTDRGVDVENIQASASGGAHPSGGGLFTLFGHTINFSITNDAGSVAVPAGSMPLGIKLFADNKNFLQLQGGLDFSGAVPKINGKVDLETEDLQPWINPKADEKKALLDQVTNEFSPKKEEKNLLPLKFTSDWTEEGLSVGLANIQMQGLNSQGAGRLDLTWKEWQPVIATQLQFSTLDYNQWKILMLALQEEQKRSDRDNSYRQSDMQQENPLPQDMQATVSIAADKLLIEAQTWQKATLSASLADGSVTVNQFNIQLPGEASLVLFGIISQGGTGGLRFEGSMETQGSSLRQMLTVFDASAADLPETGFGAFYARSNIFVSSDQMRLSEADVKISDLHLNGGLAAYYDSRPRMEADIKLKDINFDYFRDVWREKQKKAGQKDFFLKFDKTENFDWLKRLQTNIDLKISVDHFTFLERAGDSASFRLFVKEGEFGIYDVRLNYPEEITQANFHLDVRGQVPLVNLTLNTDQLNTSYFAPLPDDKKLEIAPQAETIAAPAGVVPEPPHSAETIEDIKKAPKRNEPVTNKKWPEDVIDMSWMEGFGGQFDISIDKLVHQNIELDRLKLQAKLESNLLTFQSFTFADWQGRCSILGSMYGGKVPGFSISFTLFDVELHDLLHALANRDNITGKASISGTLTTSGINYLSWASQSDAKIVLAGRGVVVQGVDLEGVIEAVNISRTAADVFNSVNMALTRGSTEFNVDGNINVKNGVMRTPGITLKSADTTGDLTGEVQLVPWTMELSTLFQFPTLSCETIPTMPVQLTGPIEAAELKTDTSSLEACKAARITGH